MSPEKLSRQQKPFERPFEFPMADIRLHLTDKDVARLTLPDKGWYLARDTELKGFFVVVGRKQKTFTIQADLRRERQRQTIRVAIGEAGDLTTREARSIGRGYLSQIARGEHPRPDSVGKRAAAVAQSAIPPNIGPTLRSAWERYVEAHMVRKGRSASTIGGYRDHVERIFVEWIDTPLAELAAQPERIAAKHDEITRNNGPL